ncbi:MAG TPA: DUF58 domain-containing protein [Gemmatimonadaceae bacterium]|nr:DUF58 domain-containing protein [Gemmatimonadaceae bacterium]
MLNFLKRRAAPKEAPAPRPARISPEILKQVKRVELKTRGLVDALFSGEYRSVFKGQGMEFSEVREYIPGDEVRTIDWNVTARMNRPFVKRYIEERELTVVLALDISGSESFGTVSRFKSDVMTEFAAVIAMAAVRNNDRVGLIFFTDRVEHVVPPRKGKRHVLRIVRDLLAFVPKGKATDLRPALEYMQRTLRQHTVIFLVSDFQDEGYEHALKVLGRRHDIVAVTLNDPAEQTLPSVGLARMRDPETGEFLEIDTSDRRVRAAYAEHIAAELAARRRVLRRSGVDEIELTTDGSVIEPLLKFFRTRETRARSYR